MSKHHGQTLEKVIRKGGHSISEVARMMNVNRRSVYNWFDLAVLRSEIIYKIGHKIMHDFSVEFPEIFKPEEFIFKKKPSSSIEESKKQDPSWQVPNEKQWQEKYMELYPRYKALLDRVTKKEYV
jgi:hypothetical protein